MDGCGPPPSTGSKALDAALAYFASDEHQQFLRKRAERLSQRPVIKDVGFVDVHMRREYGTYFGRP